jgi:hypothetical protein
MNTTPHCSRLSRRAPAAVLVAGAVLVAAPFASSAAQEGEKPRVWSGSAQINGSLFFGNNDQMILGARTSVGRADSTIEVSADLQTLYGAASTGDRPREVTKRLWLASLSSDWRPFAPTSPFVFATVESNLEKRIDARYSGGIGAKQTFVRTERTETSLSAAILAERTVPRDTTVRVPTETLARWSVRARGRHAFGDRVRFSHVTFWQPSTERVSNFLIRSTTELEYRLNRTMGLTFSFIDSYDSEAKERGAQSYNDGQLLIGASASW